MINPKAKIYGKYLMSGADRPIHRGKFYYKVGYGDNGEMYAMRRKGMRGRWERALITDDAFYQVDGLIRTIYNAQEGNSALYVYGNSTVDIREQSVGQIKRNANLINDLLWHSILSVQEIANNLSATYGANIEREIERLIYAVYQFTHSPIMYRAALMEFKQALGYDVTTERDIINTQIGFMV